MTNNFFIDPNTGLPFMGGNTNVGKFDIPTGTGFTLTDSSDILGRGYTSASRGLTEAQINDMIKSKNAPTGGEYRMFKKQLPSVVKSGVPDIIGDVLPKGTAAKAGAKAGATVGGKAITKFIPGLGLVAGLGAAGADVASGDYEGAGLNALSGLASLLPGVGTAASLGLDAVNFMRESGAGKDAVIPAAAVGIPALMRMGKGGKVAGVASKIKDFAKAHPKVTQASAFAAGPLAYNMVNGIGGKKEVPLQGNELQPANLKPVENVEVPDIGIPPELTGVPEDTLAQIMGSGAGVPAQVAGQQPTAQGNVDAILQLANQQSTHGDRYKQSLQDLIDVMPYLNELEYQRRLGLAMMSPVMKNKELMEVMKSKSAVNDLANMVDLEKSLYDQEVTQQQLQNKILGNIQVARAMGLPDEAALADPDVLSLFQKLRSSEMVSNTAMQKALLQESGANARKSAELQNKRFLANQDILNKYGTPGLIKTMLSAGIAPEQLQDNIEQLRLLGLIPGDTTKDTNDSDIAGLFKK
jgi:hypothetical protein